MQAKELNRLNHKYALECHIRANPEQPVKFTVGYLKGKEAAMHFLPEYGGNPEILPTTASFWFSASLFARGFRSAFNRYAGQKVYNEVNEIMERIYDLNKLLTK